MSATRSGRRAPAVPPLVIWGAGGHAKVVADIVRLRGKYVVAGFLDDVAGVATPGEFLGAPLYFGRDGLDRLQREGVRFLIMGFGDCRARLERGRAARADGWSLATALHPSAVVAESVEVGAGTVVAGGAVINPEVRIGEHVIVNTSASVDHDCVIGDGAHIGPGARLAGHVTVGTATSIGIGATILPRVTIGADSQIGAGSLVLEDVPEGVIVFGSPARVVRRRTPSAGSSP
jgi:UDP-N-acetylbacillosamine N-acetyltransferase